MIFPPSPCASIRLPAARHQPALRHIGVHHVEETLGGHVDDLGHVVLTRGDDENVDAAEAGGRRRDDLVARRLARWSRRNLLDFGASSPAFGGDFRKLFRFAGGEDEFRPGGGQRLGGDGAEGPGRAGHDCDLARNREQRERIGESPGHGFAPGG